MNNLKKQDNHQTEERVIPPSAWNASYVIDYCLTRLKQENAFPYDKTDLDLMPYRQKIQYERDRKVYLLNEGLNLYKSKISITCPDLDGLHINNRNLTKLCRGYLLVLEVNSKTRSPFSIAKIDVSLAREKITLNIILKGK